MPDSAFIDTWGWVALGHRKDTRHYEVKSLYKELRSQGARLLRLTTFFSNLFYRLDLHGPDERKRNSGGIDR